MLKLNLGCGTNARKGFVNIDFRPLPSVDRVFDLSSDEELYPPNTIDYIFAQDILEHFPQAETRRILESWVKMLKPGGVIEIQTPDILDVVKWAKESFGDDWMIQRIYGGQEYPGNFHKAGFTRRTMRDLLESFDLEITYEGQGGKGNLLFKAMK